MQRWHADVRSPLTLIATGRSRSSATFSARHAGSPRRRQSLSCTHLSFVKPRRRMLLRCLSPQTVCLAWNSRPRERRLQGDADASDLSWLLSAADQATILSVFLDAALALEGVRYAHGAMTGRSNSNLPVQRRASFVYTLGETRWKSRELQAAMLLQGAVVQLYPKQEIG